MTLSSRHKPILIFVLLFVMLTSPLMSVKAVQAAYDGTDIIDDSIFLDASTMSAAAIQSFLVSKGSGLAASTFVFDCTSTGMSNSYYRSAGAPCDQTVPASTILYYAAQIYGVNPQVILATMQKEQSLITSPNPTSWQINQAMGYGCPDSGGCGSSNFLYQIDNGVWALRFHMERARGNMDYWFHSTSWVCGTAKNYYKPSLYPNQNVNFYDDSGILYRTHYILNAATSAFYCYTPHAYNNPQGLYGLPVYGTTGQYYSGSYNFVTYFERWFGSTRNGQCYATDQPVGKPSGLRIDGFRMNNVDALALYVPNNTGSGCAEFHQWSPSYTTWQNHVATSQPEFDPSEGRLISLNDGQSDSRLVYIKYKATTGNYVELHSWDNTYHKWTLHTITSLPISDLSNGIIIARGNTLVYVKYKNTSYGKIEFHEFTSDLKSWASHIVSNQPASEMDYGEVIARGDKLAFVKYKGWTEGGKIEIHEWNPGYQTWASHIVTNQPASEMNYGKIVTLNDRLVYVKYKNTANHLEIHEWNPGYQTWASHIVTNQLMSEELY